MQPKIIFQPMSLEDNIDIIKWSFFENNDTLDIYKYTIEYFKELSNIKLNDYTKEEIYIKIENIVSKHYLSNQEKLVRTANKYNEIWQPYNDKYLKALSKYLNISFPKDIKEIKAYVGLIPIFPRYIDSFSFSLSPDIDNEKIIEVSAHEVCHFLWFTKWKQLYPNCKKEEFESHFITWKYSEMVVDPILNSKEINNILKVTARAYDYFYELKDNNTYVMQRLNDIYNSDNSIENIIQKGYEYTYKYFKNHK